MTVPYPKRIRWPREHYQDPERLFHLIDAHPKFGIWPKAIQESIWQSVIEQRKGDRVELLAACVMLDHVHMLVRRGRLDIIEFLNEWKSRTTRSSWSAGNRNPLWQPGMWDRTTHSVNDARRVAEYIVANPVAAGLVDEPWDWPFVWIWWWDADDPA